MDKTHLDATAAHLIRCYSETAIYSRQFLEDHGSPPTLMAKVHYFRAAVLAAMTTDARYALHPEFIEFGRVQFTDHETEQTFLLRSKGAVAIEKAKQLEVLFDIPVVANPSRVQLLMYGFDSEAMDLSVAETIPLRGRRRLIAQGAPELVGRWLYSSPDGTPPPFDQSNTDAFSDVGDLGYDEGEEDNAV